MIVGNSNWQWTNVNSSVVELDVAASMIDSTSEATLAAFDEIGTIVFNVEADHIASCCRNV